MSAHDNIALVRHYFESNLKQLRPFRQEEFSEAANPDHVISAIQHLGANLPDLRFTIHAIVAHGDEVEVFTTSEATLPASGSTHAPQRVRVCERHVVSITNGQIVAHQMDQTARVDVWDARQGWQPLTHATMPPHSALH